MTHGALQKAPVKRDCKNHVVCRIANTICIPARCCYKIGAQNGAHILAAIGEMLARLIIAAQSRALNLKWTYHLMNVNIITSFEPDSTCLTASGLNEWHASWAGAQSPAWGIELTMPCWYTYLIEGSDGQHIAYSVNRGSITLERDWAHHPFQHLYNFKSLDRLYCIIWLQT